MNQTFQFRRFGLLLRLYLEENGRWYLTKLAICFVVCVAFLSVWASVKYYESFFFLFGYILIVLNGADSTTNLSNYNKKNGKGMRFLLLPSSSAEKIIASLFVNILFCSIIIIFIVVVITLLKYFSEDISVLDKSRSGNFGEIYGYFLLISFIVLASIYFVKHYFFKLILSLYIVSQLNHYIDQIFYKFIFCRPDSVRYNLFTSLRIKRKWVEGEINNPFDEYRIDYIYLIDRYPNLIPIACLFVLLIAIWYASFLRLKESEI